MKKCSRMCDKDVENEELSDNERMSQSSYEHGHR